MPDSVKSPPFFSCPGDTWHPSWCGSDLCLWSSGALPPHPGSSSALLPPAGHPCSAGIRSWNTGRWVSICLFESGHGRSEWLENIILCVVGLWMVEQESFNPVFHIPPCSSGSTSVSFSHIFSANISHTFTQNASSLVMMNATPSVKTVVISPAFCCSVGAFLSLRK